jgi:tRNA G18 (ribose-2'-O)-methylase SpoU
VALLIGAEAQGLSPRVIESADHRITISTPGLTESLNAAVAAGIAVYELSRLSGQGEASV